MTRIFLACCGFVFSPDLIKSVSYLLKGFPRQSMFTIGAANAANRKLLCRERRIKHKSLFRAHGPPSSQVNCKKVKLLAS